MQIILIILLLAIAIVLHIDDHLLDVKETFLNC
jgi:hypothetical protein